MKKILKKIAEWLKTLVWMVLNPRFLICFGLGWMITNGWSYIALGVGVWCELEWLTAIASGYLALLWVPATPEKLITVAIAIFFLKLLFPNDEKTLGVLKALYGKAKNKRAKKKKSSKKEKYALMFDTVILGSGYFSLGFAMNHKNTLIIEDTQLLDPNFYGVLSGFDMKVEKPSAKGAVALYEAFVKEGIVGEHGLAANELEPALCRFVGNKMPGVLLGTFCVGVEKTPDGYEVSLCNNEGVSRIFAKNVIDTRVAYGNCIKFLIAVNDGKEPALSSLYPAFYGDQRVAEVRFDRNIDINDAKSKALDMIGGALSDVGARIVSTSYRMCGAPLTESYEDENAILHVDERSFGDIFAAYEKGETLK